MGTRRKRQIQIERGVKHRLHGFFCLILCFALKTAIPLVDFDGRFGLSWISPPDARAQGTDSAYRLRVVYLIPSNRTPPQPDDEKILKDYVLMIQGWYKEQMERMGFGPKTFQFETDADGDLPRVNVVYSGDPDTAFQDENYGARWSKILKGLAASGFPVWQAGDLLLIVAEIHQQLPDGTFDRRGLFFGGGAQQFAGVGMVTGDTLVRLRQEFLSDDRAYHGMIIPALGPYPLVHDSRASSFPRFEGATLSAVSSSAQGGLGHELGHGLGLWHDFRNDRNFNGNLMGNGFRGIRGAIDPDQYPGEDVRLSAGSALQLNFSKFFNSEPPSTDDQAPVVQILTSGTVRPEDGIFKIEFLATDDSELGGALLSRNGRGIAHMALSGRQVTTTIGAYDYEPGATDKWRIRVFDAQGNRTTTDEVELTCAEGVARAPVPFIEASKTRIKPGEEIILDATRSSDPDGALSELAVQWDLDGNGHYDTPLTTQKTYTTYFARPGTYQISARLQDESGYVAYSMPIGIRVVLPIDNDGDGIVDDDDPDDDNDGLPDAWEALYELDQYVYDAWKDDDHDGYANYPEYLSQSDPTDAARTPEANASSVAGFVARFYAECLARDPDDAGLAYWQENLLKGMRSGLDVAQGFIFSLEFQARELADDQYLTILYQAFFDREPDDGGRQYWLSRLEGGVQRNEILNGFLYSQEFANLCQEFGISPIPSIHQQLAGFISRFYQHCLVREADANGLNHWARSLFEGTRTGTDVAIGFVFSQEFLNRAVDNSTYLTILYRAFFDRAPDSTGYDDWLDQLEANQKSRFDVLSGFLGSPEFSNLCHRYGIIVH